MDRIRTVLIVAVLLGGVGCYLVFYLSKGGRFVATPWTELADALAAQARTVDDPWALAHALLAFGPEFRLADGRPVVDALKDDHLERSDDQVFFALVASPPRLGEVHPHLVLKTLVDVGVEPELARELLATARSNLRRPDGFEAVNDAAWLLEACGRRPGTPPSVAEADLAEICLGEVERGDAVVERALGAADFTRPSALDPETAGTYAFTCGGQHLLQGVIVAFRGGLLGPEARPRLEARLTTLCARIVAETGFRDEERVRAVAAGVPPRTATCVRYQALLKLRGHALETLSRAQRAGLGDPPTLRAVADGILVALEDDTIELMETVELSDLFDDLRRRDIDTWRLWFGDGCHALRGRALWTPDN